MMESRNTYNWQDAKETEPVMIPLNEVIEMIIAAEEWWDKKEDEYIDMELAAEDAGKRIRYSQLADEAGARSRAYNVMYKKIMKNMCGI